MNRQQRVASTEFSILEDGDVETRKVILEEIGKLWHVQLTDPLLYSKVSYAVYIRIGKRYSPSILENVLSRADAEYRKLLTLAITTSNVSNEVVQLRLHSWPYHKTFAFRYKDFGRFEKKKRRERKRKEEEEEEEEIRNRAARQMLSAQRGRNQTPRTLGNGPSTLTISAALGETQPRTRAPKRSAAQLARTPQIPNLASGMGNRFTTPTTPAASGGVQATQGAGILQTSHLPQFMQNGVPPAANVAAFELLQAIVAGPVLSGQSRADVALDAVARAANAVNTFHPNSAGLFESIIRDALQKFMGEMAKEASDAVLGIFSPSRRN